MFAARISLANLAAARATLEALGHGPDNFSEPAYTGPGPAYAVLHAWGPPDFIAAVKALPDVVWSEAQGSPETRVDAALAGVLADWKNTAIPLDGVVSPGLHVDGEGVLWWVIQQYDTALWPDPTVVPALVRRARVPGEVLPWVQPLDQFDAYKLVNPFTGEPDRVTHNGATWEVSQADGAGNNVNEPGVFGWTNLDAPQTAEWAIGVAYAVGDRVTYQGTTYECRQAHTSLAGWTPTAVPALWLAV